MTYESVFGKQQCCKCGTWHTIGTQMGLNHTLYEVNETTGEETAYTDWYCDNCAQCWNCGDKAVYITTDEHFECGLCDVTCEHCGNTFSIADEAGEHMPPFGDEWYCGDCAQEYWAEFDEYYDPFD